MSEGDRSQQHAVTGTSEQSQSDGAQDSSGPTPHGARSLRIRRARAFNRQHAGQAAEFKAFTGIEPMNIVRIRKWQSEHGVPSDGKIDEKTLATAKNLGPVAALKPIEGEAELASVDYKEEPGAAPLAEAGDAADTKTVTHAQSSGGGTTAGAGPHEQHAALGAKDKEQPANQPGDASKIAAVDPHGAPEKVAAKASTEPPAKDAKGLGAVEDKPTIVTAPQLRAEEFFAQVPNNDRKKSAYKALKAANHAVTQAQRQVDHAKGDKAKAAAEKSLMAAQKQLTAAKETVLPMVAHAIVEHRPEVVAQVEQIKHAKARLREAEAQKKRARHADEIHELDEQIKQQHTSVATLEAQLAQLKSSLYGPALEEARALKHPDTGTDVLEPADTDVDHHDFAFPDGEHVKVRDHVDSYATTVAIGVDNDGQPKSDVAGAIKGSGLSASKQKILSAISNFEGKFDTINTYDRATLTWGFVQWAGGSESDLTKALAIIKKNYPDGFARAFQQYGIDVRNDNVVVTMPDGTTVAGDEAAQAVMKNPKLAAAMVHAGRDPDVQKGEIRAADHLEIDVALAKQFKIGKHSVAASTLLTSEYGVGLLANTYVHSGPQTAEDAIKRALSSIEEPYVPDDEKWGAKAEDAIRSALAATDGERAASLSQQLNHARNSYQ